MTCSVSNVFVYVWHYRVRPSLRKQSKKPKQRHPQYILPQSPLLYSSISMELFSLWTSLHLEHSLFPLRYNEEYIKNSLNWNTLFCRGLRWLKIQEVSAVPELLLKQMDSQAATFTFHLVGFPGSCCCLCSHIDTWWYHQCIGGDPVGSWCLPIYIQNKREKKDYLWAWGQRE